MLIHNTLLCCGVSLGDVCLEDYTAVACVQFQCVCVRACMYVFVFVCVCGVLVCVVVCVFVCWLCVYNIHVCMCVCMFNKSILANASRGGGVIAFPLLLQIEIHFTKQNLCARV